MNRLLVLVPAGLLTLAGIASAQGSDSCSTPVVIAGTGSFPWSNSGATQSPEGQAACVAAVHRDVWFTWTAPESVQYTLDNCGLTGMNSVFAVYAGAVCPTAPSIACNDNACGPQSRVSFAAVAGATYTFQLGQALDVTGFGGSFRLSQGVPAQCGGSIGPDVIVGDVSDVSNYTAANGLDAIALGTTSCNVGSSNLSWVASTNQHPVIGGNLYRYEVVDGAPRFEQIGLSWLKHGFAATSGTLCCTCQGGGGSSLGVGCSDPYTSGMNGSQPTLGPRWQVNASTGGFTYPAANPAWSGATARRIEFLLSDVGASGPGTRWFGECQYVTPDDAAAGNQDNNASWREMTVSGTPTNVNFAMLGLTRQTQSAIRAWKQIDPQVVLSDVDVPGDGLFVVGSRAFALGGGQWRYEFAVYNMNSHRSGGWFSVPVPVGANVTNAGFHDVTYRNGDGQANVNQADADWTVVVAPGSVAWTTETFAVNTNANALRWGTTYNFRFDCDVAPANGSVDLGLWRTGVPASMNADARVPGPLNGSASICSGDGTGAACPCGNNGIAGTGCANSFGNGAAIVASGTASVSADTLLLTGSGMPDSSCLYFQGTNAVDDGAGVAFGDGLRCAGGFVSRLGTKTNAAGTSSYPQGGDPAVSVRGNCSPGDVRTYQVWYRNAAAFCTADTFNLSNGWRLVWQS